MTVTLAAPLRGGRVARNAALNVAALVAPLLVAVVTVPILISALGTERFGVLAIAWLLLSYVSELGLGSTTTRYVAAAIGEGRLAAVGALAWTTAGLQLAIGAVEGVALALATPWLVGSVLQIPAELAAEARTSLYLLAAAVPLVGLGRSFRGVVEAAHRFDLALAVHVPATAGGYVLAAAAATAGWSLPAVFALIILPRVLAFPAYLLAAARALPETSLRPAWNASGLGGMAGFAGWVAVSTVVSPLLAYLDRFMVGMLLTMTAVTWYAAPYEVVGKLALIPVGVMGALFPAFSQLGGGDDRDRAQRLAGRAVAMVVVVLGPILVLLIGGAADGLTLWLGPEYARESALALRILAVGVLVNAIAHVPFGLLQGWGRPDLPARFHLLELPIQVGLAWALVARFGIPGAALAWTGRVVLDAALLFTATSRLGLLRAAALGAERVPRALGLVLAGAAVALLGSATLPSLAARLALVGAVAAGTSILLWATAMTAEERGRIVAMVRGKAA